MGFFKKLRNKVSNVGKVVRSRYNDIGNVAHEFLRDPHQAVNKLKENLSSTVKNVGSFLDDPAGAIGQGATHLAQNLGIDKLKDHLEPALTKIHDTYERGRGWVKENAGKAADYLSDAQNIAGLAAKGGAIAAGLTGNPVMAAALWNADTIIDKYGDIAQKGVEAVQSAVD